MNIHVLYTDMGTWACTTFPNVPPAIHLAKAGHEVKEAIADPADIKEYADIHIATWAAAFKQGFTLDQVMQAVRDKLEAVKSLAWAEQSDGTHQSIKPGAIEMIPMPEPTGWCSVCNAPTYIMPPIDGMCTKCFSTAQFASLGIPATHLSKPNNPS